MSEIKIFKDEQNNIELDVQFDGDTVWSTQTQMVTLFESSKANISEHIKAVIESGEIDEKPTVRKFRTVQKEGERQVKRNLNHYNLDMIISVGYKVNSRRGIQFRKWATSKLKDLLVQGYVINQKRLAQKEQEVKMLKSGIQIIGRAIEQRAEEQGFEWLDTYATGLTLLDDYDHESLDKSGISKKETNYPKRAEYYEMVEAMKADFDSDIFGKEKDEYFQSSVTQYRKEWQIKTSTLALKKRLQCYYI